MPRHLPPEAATIRGRLARPGSAAGPSPATPDPIRLERKRIRLKQSDPRISLKTIDPTRILFQTVIQSETVLV
jgi:hypothetical protein